MIRDRIKVSMLIAYAQMPLVIANFDVSSKGRGPNFSHSYTYILCGCEQ